MLFKPATFILFISALLLGGCRGYVPASLLVAPPALLPVKLAQPKEKFDPLMAGVPRPVERQTFISIDYSAGPGTLPQDYVHLVRANLMFATANGGDGDASRIGIGGMVFGGFYTGRDWQEPQAPPVDRNIIGMALYADGCIDIAPGKGGLGIGWHIMAAAEGGAYASVWNQHSSWPLPFIPQLGAYIFMNSELSDMMGITLRGGMAIPGPLYFNSSFAWDRIMVGITGGYTPKEPPRYTGGISYRF